jgi:hypothetical protein
MSADPSLSPVSYGPFVPDWQQSYFIAELPAKYRVPYIGRSYSTLSLFVYHRRERTGHRKLGLVMDLQRMLQRAGFSPVISIVYATLCFKETAEGLRDIIARVELPHPLVVEITQLQLELGPASFTDAATLHVILGAHLLTVLPRPRTYIVFNMEQLSSRAIDYKYMLMMSAALVVCDASPANVQVLQQRLQSVFCCQVPLYVPAVPAALLREPTIDVLFYGSEHSRRVRMLHLLREQRQHAHSPREERLNCRFIMDSEEEVSGKKNAMS